MTRRQRTAKQRLAIFEEHGGTCHICGAKVQVGEAWELEHVVPYAMTLDDSDENLRPAHIACHRGKTAEDVGNLAKANRVKAKHQGARKPKATIPGSRSTRWKKKIDGTVVPR